MKFRHQALQDAQAPTDKLIYTAMSKNIFYLRLFVSKFVLDQGSIPLNPFTSFDYFLIDTVDRDVVRRGNNTLVARADEIWTFGAVSDGVLAELIQAHKAGKPVRYFSANKHGSFAEISIDEIKFEEDIANREAEYKQTYGR